MLCFFIFVCPAILELVLCIWRTLSFIGIFWGWIGVIWLGGPDCSRCLLFRGGSGPEVGLVMRNRSFRGWIGGGVRAGSLHRWIYWNLCICCLILLPLRCAVLSVSWTWACFPSEYPYRCTWEEILEWWRGIPGYWLRFGYGQGNLSGWIMGR